MDPLFADLAEDLSSLSVEELQAYIDTAQEKADRIAENPAEYLVEGRDFAALKAEMEEGVSRIKAAKDELHARTAAVEDEEEEAADTDEELTAEQEELAALAALARDEPEEETAEEAEEDVPVEAAAETEEVAEEQPEEAPVEEPVTASAKPAIRKRLARPARSRESAPPPEEKRVALTAAAEGLGFGLGAEIPDENAIAEMMIRRRSQFGRSIPEGTHGDQIPIVRADWSDLYPAERTLSADDSDTAKVQAVTADAQIQKAFVDRRSDASLTASGGLCAPVTPYYQLQMLSVANRPVRAALPAFSADRGGIKAARPASLSAITTAVDIRTAAEDAIGGTVGAKTCQVIDCPPFTETDVQIIFHCLQFGNLGARTFPELVAQWNSLVLAAHARTAETALLDGIGAASTHVTASGLGLGASSDLLSQALTAAQGMRSRHRMDPNAVLRVLYPYWVLDLLVSDVYRTQFDRFDMSGADFVRLLRAGNIEPTFYMDGETGLSQVYGAQTASSLLPFPATVAWYLYPEGSFLYLDGGVLELGLVRDSVLNQSNDFQIFGESFENVAFIGIESLRIVSTTCDSGTVSAPHATTCPVSYA